MTAFFSPGSAYAPHTHEASDMTAHLFAFRFPASGAGGLNVNARGSRRISIH